MSRRRGGRHPKVRMRVESSVAYPGHDSAPGTTGHGGAAGIGLQVPGWAEFAAHWAANSTAGLGFYGLADGCSGYLRMSGGGAPMRSKASPLCAGGLGQHRHGGAGSDEPDLVTSQGRQVLKQAGRPARRPCRRTPAAGGPGSRAGRRAQRRGLLAGPRPARPSVALRRRTPGHSPAGRPARASPYPRPPAPVPAVPGSR